MATEYPNITVVPQQLSQQFQNCGTTVTIALEQV